jgi:hypothetical protein
MRTIVPGRTGAGEGEFTPPVLVDFVPTSQDFEDLAEFAEDSAGPSSSLDDENAAYWRREAARLRKRERARLRRQERKLARVIPMPRGSARPVAREVQAA